MAEEKTPKKKDKKLAIILIRGLIGMKKSVKDTAKMLKLKRKNTCIVVSDNPVMRGMANKLKDFVTFGELDEETHKLLIEKRGKGKEEKIFHLSPPRKGFERKGIKQPFSKSGALGYRKDKINDLIKRMV